MIDKHARPTKLLWVDLEMTGLNPEVHRILEIAAFVTDFSLQRLPESEFHAIIHQPDEILDAASEVAKQMDALNGLHEQVRTRGRPEHDVEQEFAAHIKRFFGGEAATLAGNSIHQDRRFIRQWWPEVEQLLHYRMLDVSSLKVYMHGKYGLTFDKKETHRAIDDIQESIDEWQYYVSWLEAHGSQGS